MTLIISRSGQLVMFRKSEIWHTSQILDHFQKSDWVWFYQDCCYSRQGFCSLSCQQVHPGREQQGKRHLIPKGVMTCQDLHQAPVSSGDEPNQWAGGVWYEAHGIRHELNLCVGSPVTAAYGVSDNESESSQRLSWRWTEMMCQAMWRAQSEYMKEPEVMTS